MLNWNHAIKRSLAWFGPITPAGFTNALRRTSDLMDSARWLREHSLTIFLLITGMGWVALYAAMDSEAKWGQVVGNVVSEWTQIIGLVLMTKRLTEPHSKESKGEH